ncbi:HK97 family phage prohead protease [Sphingomonas montana]|uniref:HK97 family phage prohead protease n=1 Tax=Sphingomonas montana TaxID=1843236 RepID=UPI00096C9665|nr:HK97 family phage prohead protease [Sphingomonas montana]
MNELDFALDTKSIDDDGNITGLAVGFGNVDHGGDIVAKGAIDLQGRKSLPMLLFHDQKRPAGAWHSFEEVSDGLLTKGRFSTSQTGKDAREDVRSGALAGMSMGFKTLKHRMEGKSRHLLHVALHEISLVTIPMNDRTRVMSFKDILGVGDLPTVRDFEDHLRDAGFSRAKATAMASACAPHLRGDPEAKAIDEAMEFLSMLRA